MRFKHDPAKAAANLRKHGVAFADAEGVFEDPLAVTVEDPDAEGEQRFVSIGLGSGIEKCGGTACGGPGGARWRVPTDPGASADAKGAQSI